VVAGNWQLLLSAAGSYRILSAIAGWVWPIFFSSHKDYSGKDIKSRSFLIFLLFEFVDNRSKQQQQKFSEVPVDVFHSMLALYLYRNHE